MTLSPKAVAPGTPSRFGVYFNSETRRMLDSLVSKLNYRNTSQLLSDLVKQEYEAQFQETTESDELDPNWKYPWERDD